MSPERSPMIFAALIVVMLAIVGSVGVAVMIGSLESKEKFPEFEISGTYNDGTSSIECSGTATYRDLNESSRERVFMFDYSLTCAGNSIKLTSTLFLLKETKSPNEEFYTECGRAQVDGVDTLKWAPKDTSKGLFTYYVSGDGKIMKIDIAASGVTAEAVWKK